MMKFQSLQFLNLRRLQNNIIVTSIRAFFNYSFHNTNSHMDLKSQDSIQVCIRIRPGSQQESIVQFTDTQIHLDKNHFGFDKIFPPSATQQEIFQQVGTKLIARTLDGYNGCIFVYGQTGSGKTYTMMGDGNGLMQKSFLQLFVEIGKLQRTQSNIYCSYYEIYNEQIIDLLDTRKDKKLNIRQDLKKGVFVENMTEETVIDSNKLLECLNTGMRNRHVGETMMNRQSSRSHSIFTISFSMKSQINGSQVIKTPKLHFVDLAGSERQKMTAASGDRLKQAGNINKSLTTLGMVINALASEKSRTHIPYRDSKLTCLLRDSLGGNSKTYLIATVSRNILCFQETLSTLNFANRAKMVKVKALVNEESLSTNIETYKQQIRKLKAEIQRLKSQKPSPLSQQIRWLPQKIETNINYDKRFEQINDKISVISDHLIKNPSSPSLEELMEQIRKIKPESFGKTQSNEMIAEVGRQSREQNMQNEVEEMMEKDEEDPLIQYLSCNNSLLQRIHQKIDEYVQIKSQLRNYAYNNQLTIAALKTPSKFEREQLEGIIEKRNAQINSLHEQLKQLKQIISDQQIRLQNYLNESISKNYANQQNSEKYQKQRTQMQRQLNTLKNLSKQANQELQIINNKYIESQTQYKQTRQLYLFAQQNYQTQRTLRDQIQTNLMEKINQLEKLKIQYCEKIDQQKEYFEEIQEGIRQELVVLAQTVEFNQGLIADYQAKISQQKDKAEQYMSRIQVLQQQVQEAKKQKDELEQYMGQLQQKIADLTHQLKQTIQRYSCQIEQKQEELRNLSIRYQESQETHTNTQRTLKQRIQTNENKIKGLQECIVQREQQVQQLTEFVELQTNRLKNQHQNIIKNLQQKIAQNTQYFNNQLNSSKTQKQQISLQLTTTKQNLHDLTLQLQTLQHQLSQTQRQAQQKISLIYEQTKQKLEKAKILEIQNEQLKKQYKILQKQSYKIKAKSSENNNKSQQQLALKVDFYQEKFKLMSIEYQKAMEVVKKLKEKELGQAERMYGLEEANKALKLSMQNQNVSEGSLMIKSLSQENQQLKRQLQIIKSSSSRQESAQSYLNKVSIQQQKNSLKQKEQYLKKKIQQSINRWDPSKQNVIKDRSLEELICCWEQLEAESCKKLDAVAKGIKKQQKLKAQNSLILKQNIYLKQQLTNFEKNSCLGLPTKRVKLDLMQIAEDQMQ